MAPDRPRLSLARAQAEGRLDAFVKQEEERGVGPIDSDAFDAELRRSLRGSRSGDRTSRSASQSYSRGRKTR
jgi:hypothetical protein